MNTQALFSLPAHSIRQRTVAVVSPKGGVGKTTITASLAYEAARLGFNVLVVDASGTGGVSSLMNRPATTHKHATPGGQESERSIADALHENLPAPAYPVDAWTPDPATPWHRGGPAIPGGQVLISPTPPGSSGRMSITDVLAQAGTTAETRLARALDTHAASVDLILIDTPGTDTPSVLSSIFHAAQHIIVPLHLHPQAVETLEQMTTKITTWTMTTGKDVHLLGALPTAVPIPLGDYPAEQDALRHMSDWISQNPSPQITLMTPGIPKNEVFSHAEHYHLPAVQLATTRPDTQGSDLPAALTTTALTMLAAIQKIMDTHPAGTPLFDVQALQEAVSQQAMPSSWREIITGADLGDTRTTGHTEVPTHHTQSATGARATAVQPTPTASHLAPPQETRKKKTVGPYRRARRREDLDTDIRMTVRLEDGFRSQIQHHMDQIEDRTGYMVNFSQFCRAALASYDYQLTRAYADPTDDKLVDLFSFLGPDYHP